MILKDYLQTLLVDCHGQVRQSCALALALLMTINVIMIVSKLLKKVSPKNLLMKSVFKLVVKEEYLEKKLREACVDLHKFKESGIAPIRTLPKKLDNAAILDRLNQVRKMDTVAEATGKVCTNYYTPYDEDHKKFVTTNAGPFLYANMMHFDTNKGAILMENEMLLWIMDLFNAPKGACGTLTSGGTESIFQACVAYRELAKQKGITNPEIVINESGHVGFSKASFYLGIKLVIIPIDRTTGLSKTEDFKNAINANTVAVACSGINYAHGLIDQIGELNEYLKETDVWIAIDSCLGGFTTSISYKLGDGKFPVIDFRLERVGTISVDPHKYGEGPKGCSVILFRNEQLKKGTVFVSKDWNGGLYVTSSLAGSRGAAPMVGSWISLASLGFEGLVEAYKDITSTCDYLRDEILKLEQLAVIGNPVGCGLAFRWKGSDKNTLRLQLALSKLEWRAPTTQFPTTIRITITRANVQKLKKTFIPDLIEAIRMITENPTLYSDSFELMLYGTLLKVPNGKYIEDVLKNLQIQSSKLSVDD